MIPKPRSYTFFIGIVLSLILLSGIETCAQKVTNNGIKLRIPANAHMVIHGDYISTSAEGTITLDGNLSVFSTPFAGGTLSATAGPLFLPADESGMLKMTGSGIHHVRQPGIIQLDGLEITSTSGALQLQHDQSMTIYGPLVIHGWLIMNSGASGSASLITKGSVTGLSQVYRYIESKGDHNQDWHLLSSPVNNQSISPEFTVDSESPYSFFLWLETDSTWVDFDNTTTPPTFFSANGNSNNFIPGRGYKAGYDKSVTPVFSGELNTSTIPLTGLTNTEGDSHTGWNLIGNPFPCALQWNHTDGASGWALNNVSGTAKVWDDALASYHDVYKDEIIPSMQGFMVQVVSGGLGSLSLYEGDRIHDTLNWYKTIESNVIRLMAVDVEGEKGQESVIRFQEGTTLTFDHQYDSHFLSGYAPQFYSLNDGHKLSTNVLPSLHEELSIPFSFIRNSSTAFSIKATGLTSLTPASTVYLTDLKHQITHNLSNDSAYNFISEEGDDPQRFVIHFRAVGIENANLSPDPIRIWNSEHILYIHNPQSHTGEIGILNIIGQSMLKTELTGDVGQSVILTLNPGIYVATVTSGHGVTSKKILIQ